MSNHSHISAIFHNAFRSRADVQMYLCQCVVYHIDLSTQYSITSVTLIQSRQLWPNGKQALRAFNVHVSILYSTLILHFHVLIAWCVENEPWFGRQNIVGATFLRKIIAMGAAVLETEGNMGTKGSSM